MAKEVKKPTLEEVLKKLEKDFGKGSVITGSENNDDCEVISTGSLGLDAATGIGGLPLGKIVEIIGWLS